MSSSQGAAPIPADPRRWVALGLLASAQFLVTLDSSIVNVALPSLQADLGLSESGLAWVVNAYVLAFGGFLLLFGRAGDLFGRREVFMSGAALFTAASLLAGVARSPELLLTARALQGLGAAALSPAALSIVITTFSDRERAKALGIWGAVAAGGGSAGVLFGGLITDSLGWQWVFFLTVPISAAATALAPVLLGRVPGAGVGAGFDALGALTVTGGVTAAVYAMLHAGEAGWTAASTWALFALAAALLAGFVAVERRVKSPLVPLRVFRSRNFSGGNAVALLGGATLMSMFFFVSLYLQQVLGYGPRQTGFAYLPMTLTIFTVSVLAIARVVARLGVRTVLMIGLTLLAAGLGWLARTPVDANYATDVLPGLVVAAVGLGFTFMPSTMAAISGVRPAESGLASGMVNTAFQVGGPLGIAALASLATGRITDATANGTTGPAALAEGFGAAFTAGAGLALTGALAAAIVLRRSAPVPPPADLPATRVPEREPAPVG